MSKLLEYRERLNLTQSELAEKSGVSVRTIQRIEAGADLKGHTLKVIASALDVAPSELTETAEEEKKDKTEEFNYGTIKLVNLSCLLFFIPLGNILLPLLIMRFKKEVNDLTKQIVSIQIVWTIISAVAFVTSPFIQKWFSLNRQLILVVLMVCFLVNIWIILRNAMELDKNKRLRIKLKSSVI